MRRQLAERVDLTMEGGTRNGATGFGGEHFRRLAAIAVGTLALTALALVTVASPAAAADSQILYFEPLQLATSLAGPPDSPLDRQGQRKSSRSREVEFDAYGRHFVLTLEPNDKLSPLLHAKSGSSDLELYRGQINGVAGSWARLSMAEGQIQGMLWDGAELYIIEPVAELGDSLPVNAATDPDATAIFRLADVVMTPGAASCGTETDESASKGTDAYASMLSELKGSPAIMQAAGATRRLEVSALGDLSFMNRYGTEARARDEILRRINNVDGIYSSQLGIEISVPSIDIGDSLSDTTAPSSLLNELAALRKRTPNLNSRGLTHLFTGRDLDGTTVGIAYINSVCDRQYGAGLTQAGNGAWTESLIAAHEIGHNFGAPHDGDSSQTCGGTPTGSFLMSPSINGSDKFSSCSLSIMQPRAASASCVTALTSADIAVGANLGSVQQRLDTPFDWEVTVRNTGGLATSDTRVEITLPAALAVKDAAAVAGGTCVSGAGHVICEIDRIPGGSVATIQLTLRSAVADAHAIAVNVSASNESNFANNHGEGTISTQPEVDLALNLQAPASVGTGSAFNVALSATNLSDIVASNVTLSIALPEGVTAASATFNGNSCTVGTGSISCSLPSLTSGASVTGTATLTASAAGTATLQAQISSGHIDPVTNNDTASATVSVTGVAASASQAASSGGGGGGAAGPSLLAMLLAMLGLKSLARRPSRSLSSR